MLKYINFKFQISLLNMNKKSCHCRSTHPFKGTPNLSESAPFTTIGNASTGSVQRHGEGCTDTLYYGSFLKFGFL